MVMCSEPVMRAPFSGCLGANSSRIGHQAGHFGLGNADFLAAPGGQRQVGNDVILFSGGFENSTHGRLQNKVEGH